MQVGGALKAQKVLPDAGAQLYASLGIGRAGRGRDGGNQDQGR
jgi:hypothetical protein